MDGLPLPPLVASSCWLSYHYSCLVEWKEDFYGCISYPTVSV